MTTREFFKRFPDEASCIQHMRTLREENGLTCRACDSTRMSWLSTCNRWECMDCRAKTTIRSGTILMHSKLPVHTWYTCMFLMTSTPQAVSAKELQQRLGLKRYEPVWYMMQKIRQATGKVNESVVLSGEIELDNGYFTAHKEPNDGDELFNQGRGNVRKQPVLVTVESWDGAKRPSAGRLRMTHLPNHAGVTYSKPAQRLLNPNAFVRSDADPAYKSIEPHVQAHLPEKSALKNASQAFPWVHIANSNAKRLFLEVYHHLSAVWLQSYLDEFCFKFNGRRCREDSVIQLFRTAATTRLHICGPALIS